MNKLMLILFVRLARAVCYIIAGWTFYWTFGWEMMYWHKTLSEALLVSNVNFIGFALSLIFAIDLGVLEDFFGLKPNTAAAPIAVLQPKPPKERVLYCQKCKRVVTKEDWNEMSIGNGVHKGHKLVWKTIEVNNGKEEVQKKTESKPEGSAAPTSEQSKAIQAIDKKDKKEDAKMPLF